MTRAFLYASVLVALALPARVAAQPTLKLQSLNKSGTITANGGSVELLNTGGMAGLRVQSTGTYTGTWEIQCSAAPAGATPVYDADDEVNLTLEGASSAPVQSVTDAVAEWTANIQGCTAIQAIATSAMTGTLTIYLSATTTAGGGGSGGSSAAGTVDPTTATAWGIRAEDAAHTTADPGVFVLSKRTDVAASSAGTDGDYATLNTDASGRLWVNCGTGCSGGTQFAEDAAHTTGDVGTVAMGVRADTAASLSGTTGDYNPFLTDALGKLWVTGSFSEDAAHTSADTGIFVMGIRRDTTPASSSGTAGDYSAFNVDSNGRLYTNSTIYNSSGTELTLATDKAEDAAHVSGDTGPVVMAKRTDAAAVSSGTDGDYSTVNVDALGQVWTRQLDPCTGVAKTFLPINISTATTTEITPSLAGASTNYYVCSLVLVTAAANNVAIADDDTDNCASVTAGMAGGTTAASGFNLAANGGLTLGNGGSTIMKTNGTNRVICIVTSAATQLSGVMSVVAAP